MPDHCRGPRAPSRRRRSSPTIRPPHRAVGAVISVLVCALVLGAMAVAGAAEGGADEHPLIREARANVAAVAEQLERAVADEADAARALAQVDEQMAALEQRVNAAAEAVRLQEAEIALAAEHLQELRAEAEALADGLRTRAVNLFKNGGSGPLELFLAAEDPQAAIDRSAFLTVLTETDRAELERVVAARAALAAASERFDVEMARLERMQAEEESLLDAVLELREDRAAVLADTQEEVAHLHALEDDLSDDVERIERLIADARSTPVAASPPSTAGYGWPLCRAITSRFGYRWGRQHKGIDIDGDTGDPVAASKAGVVIAAGYEGGYGNLVLIDHGDGVVTAYAHQSEILVFRGQAVERGERIGSVGNTGNSTGPHLHFETRVNGTAVDPLQYLPSSC